MADPKKITPQAVSAALKRAGWNPTPRNREGVHVTKSFHGATVSCDWDSDRTSREQAPFIRKALEDAGYTVTQRADLTMSMFVVGKKEG